MVNMNRFRIEAIEDGFRISRDPRGGFTYYSNAEKAAKGAFIEGFAWAASLLNKESTVESIEDYWKGSDSYLEPDV